MLDTNVLSELMRDNPAPAVMSWLDSHDEQSLHTTAVTQAEILAGIAVLPEGRRRDALATGAEQLFKQDFSGRCLVFNSTAAEHYAMVRAQRQRAGKPISTEDALIAAIVLAANFCLVTRNVKDFEGLDGLQVINPWPPH